MNALGSDETFVSSMPTKPDEGPTQKRVTVEGDRVPRRLDGHGMTEHAIVTIETIYTSIALLSCDQVCIDFRWLLYSGADHSVESTVRELALTGEITAVGKR